MKASNLSFRGGVSLAVVGMIWGIAMAISQDHSTMPAHAHLNLLGWVSLFLFGVFYHLHPALDSSRVAVAQVCVWIIGVVAMAFGVGLLTQGREIGEPIAAISSILLVADMLVFGWFVFRRERTDPARQASLAGAE